MRQLQKNFRNKLIIHHTTAEIKVINGSSTEKWLAIFSPLRLFSNNKDDNASSATASFIKMNWVDSIHPRGAFLGQLKISNQHFVSWYVGSEAQSAECKQTVVAMRQQPTSPCCPPQSHPTLVDTSSEGQSHIKEIKSPGTDELCSFYWDQVGK